MTTPRRRGPYQRQPHPMEPQIRELLAQGLNNARIIEQLNAPPRVVARVRKEAGIAPAPRSTWPRKPHPKAQQIHDLLADGHSDAEIRRRSGADLRAIAAMRAAGGYGKATIKPKPRPHPRDAEIRALLADQSTDAIARQLRVDRAAVRRIRVAVGIPYIRPEQARTLEEKWATHTKTVDGGHLEWTGEHATTGTPVVSYKEKHYSAAAVAFRIKHGRDPDGYAIADCGLKHCVAPDHVEDEAGRRRNREQLRYVLGGRERKPYCVHGHDQAVHGRYTPDGTAYCGTCTDEQKRAARRAEAAA